MIVVLLTYIQESREGPTREYYSITEN